MIRTQINRPSAEDIDALKNLSPNDLGHHFHFGFTDAGIKFMETTETARMVGPVITVQIPPEDSTMVHKSTEIAQEGDVIVVSMQGHTENAPWGEMTTRAAIARGVEGVVVDGSITDSREMTDLDFPAYARGRSARTTRLHGRGGEINAPVPIGGAVVRPGDIAIGNEDGVLFLRAENIGAAIECCDGIQHEEAAMQQALEAGKSLADLTEANDLINHMEHRQ